MLRMCLVYADRTKEYVDFEYELSTGGEYWTTSSFADRSGVLVDWIWPYVRARTALAYYDYSGSVRVWTAELTECALLHLCGKRRDGYGIA